MRSVFLYFFLLGITVNASSQKLPYISSRENSVKIEPVTRSNTGTGFFIDQQHIVTCFHVVGDTTLNDRGVFKYAPIIRVTSYNGEVFSAKILSIPKSINDSLIKYDFVIYKIESKINFIPTLIPINQRDETEKIGKDVVFSGYPLKAPMMLTHRGNVSGYNEEKIAIQSSVNQGNSGGALVSDKGEIIGIITHREGGITNKLNVRANMHFINDNNFLGDDPNKFTSQAVKEFDKHISTGIGYAMKIKFLNHYLQSHYPEITLKFKRVSK